MHKRPIGWCLALLFAVVIAAPALAIDPIPKEKGWGGYVRLGPGYVDITSNLVAGNSIVKVGDAVASPLTDSPPSDSKVYAALDGEVHYTFGNQWQAFFGKSVEDLVTLDGSGQLGIRKQKDGLGIFAFGVLNSAFPSHVWEDPYDVGVTRDDTNRGSRGVQFEWDRIGGSGFGVQLSARNIDVDKELSGAALVTSGALTTAEQAQLRRKGDETSGSVSYRWKIGKQQLLIPEVSFTNSDRDGSAISSTTQSGKISYAYGGDPWSIGAAASFGKTEYDEPNPVFGKATDTNNYLVQVSLLYRLPAESKRWGLSLIVANGKQDSDVNFQDSDMTYASLGVSYRLGPAKK